MAFVQRFSYIFNNNNNPISVVLPTTECVPPHTLCISCSLCRICVLCNWGIRTTDDNLCTYLYVFVYAMKNISCRWKGKQELFQIIVFLFHVNDFHHLLVNFQINSNAFLIIFLLNFPFLSSSGIKWNLNNGSYKFVNVFFRFSFVFHCWCLFSIVTQFFAFRRGIFEMIWIVLWNC